MGMTSWRAWPWALGLSCGVVLLHLWLRQCPSEVDVLPPFRRLRAECLRVYAELLTVLALTGAQEVQTEDPLAEVLDQPLVLSSALSACALRVAKHLGWRSEDLEAVVASYARLPEVMEGLSELQELHRSCLETGLPPALGSKNPWLSENLEQDSTRALQVLQDLGERKAQKLAELKPGPGLGPQILQLCEEVEQEFWASGETSESSESTSDALELSFGSAVLALDSGEFQERYTKLMKDLEVKLPSLGRAGDHD